MWLTVATMFLSLSPSRVRLVWWDVIAARVSAVEQKTLSAGSPLAVLF